MAKFKLEWSQTMIEYWEVEIEGDNEEEVRDAFNKSEHVSDTAVLKETTMLEDEIQNITEITEE